MKKALKIGGIAIAALLLILFLSPYLFKDRIESEVKKMVNRTLKSEINFSGTDISFFRHFPYLSLTLRDFSLMSSAPFEKDTLISARDISFGVDLSSLFGKNIRITRIYFNRARVNILYNTHGDANFNVYESSGSDTTSASADTAAGTGLKIEHIIFSNCRVLYADPAIPVRVEARGLNYAGTSDLTGDIFHLVSKVDIDSLDVAYGSMKIIDSKPLTAKLSTAVNTRDFTVILEKNDLKIKDIPLQFHGKFNFDKKGYQVNLSFLSVLEKEFLSARFKLRQYDTLWVSAKANAGIDLSKWSKALGVTSADLRGLFEFNLTAEGQYVTGPVKKGIRGATDTVILSIPQFSLMTRLTGGYVKYRALPQPLEKIGFSLNAECPGSDYHDIRVSLENLNASFLGNAISGFFRLKNLRNWPVEAELNAGCDLAQLKQVVPLDSLSLSGKFGAGIKVKGDYLPEQGKFPVTTASLTLENGSVQTKYYPHPVSGISVKADVTSRNGTLKDLAVNIRPFTFRFEDQSFTMHAALEDFDDLKYDVQATGVIDLGKVYKVFSRQGLDLNGFIEANLSLKGRQSDAAAGRYTRLDNRGTLKMKDIALRSDYFPKPFIIRSGEFGFDREKFRVDALKAEYGSSDFTLHGYTRNTISYFLSKGATLKGDLQLTSNLINADEFRACAAEMGDTSHVATGPAGVVMLPRDLDLVFG
ncbi:MAG TPA: AsmA family protein, partial [Bacteroidales bacterium]|nr:AsmA family protein [Bacteroidales bacterium]